MMTWRQLYDQRGIMKATLRCRCCFEVTQLREQQVYRMDQEGQWHRDIQFRGLFKECASTDTEARQLAESSTNTPPSES